MASFFNSAEYQNRLQGVEHAGAANPPQSALHDPEAGMHASAMAACDGPGATSASAPAQHPDLRSTDVLRPDHARVQAAEVRL